MQRSLILKLVISVVSALFVASTSVANAKPVEKKYEVFKTKKASSVKAKSSAAGMTSADFGINEPGTGLTVDAPPVSVQTKKVVPLNRPLELLLHDGEPTSIAVGPGTPYPWGTVITLQTQNTYMFKIPWPVETGNEDTVYSIRGYGVFRNGTQTIDVGGKGYVSFGGTCPENLENVFSFARGESVAVPEGATAISFASTRFCLLPSGWPPTGAVNQDPAEPFAVIISKAYSLPDADLAKGKENPIDDTAGMCKATGYSVVNIDSQVLGETIALPKSGGLSLHYSSDRTPAYRVPFKIDVPLTSEHQKYDIEVAGSHYIFNSYGNTSNFSYLWDGYDANYNMPSTSQIAYVHGMIDDESSVTQALHIGGFNAKVFGLGGWSFNKLHYYDQNAKRLYLGSGDSVASPLVTLSADGRVGILSNDGSEIYELDPNNDLLHIRTINARTGTTLTSFYYDDSKRVIQIDDAFGNSTFLAHNPNQVAIYGPRGHANYLSINGDGNLYRVVHPGGQTFTVEAYNGQLFSLAKPGGDVHSYSYDEMGRLLKDTGPLGRTLELVRDNENMSSPVRQTTSENRSLNLSFGRDTQNNYLRTEISAHGSTNQTKISSNLLSSSSSDGISSLATFANDPKFGEAVKNPESIETTLPSGLKKIVTFVKSMSDIVPDQLLYPSNEETRITTNGVATSIRTSITDPGSLTTETTTTSAAGRISGITSDAFGRTVAVHQTGLADMVTEYNTSGNLVQVSQGDRETTLTYDDEGNISSVTDAEGHATAMTYDRNGAILGTVRANASSIAYTYDANMNLKTVTPPNRPSHEFLVDALNRVIQMISPNLASSSSVFTDSFKYNTDNDVTKITKSDGSILDFEFQTGNTRLDRIRTPLGNYEYSYLPNSLRMSEVRSPSGVTTEFGYDGDLVTNVTQAGAVGGSVSYEYDNFLRIKQSVVTAKGGTSAISVVNYTYDDDGLITAAGPLEITRNSNTGFVTGTSVDGVVDNRAYNSFGEITEYVAVYRGALLYSYKLTRDKLGRVSAKLENIGGEETDYKYSYDSMGFLTEVKANGAIVGTYSYDANGSRKITSDNGRSFASIADEQDRITIHGDLKFRYGSNGDLTLREDSSTGDTVTFIYDTRGNLNSAALPGSCEISYLSDGLNRRIGKKFNGSIEEQYVYENEDKLAASLDAAGKLKQRYVHALGKGAPDLVLQEGATYRVITDHIGSTRLIVNAATGEIIRSMQHDAWGRVLLDSNPGFTPYGFAGGIYDADTKLVRFGARDYNSETATWTNKDPIKFASGDTNFYAYVGNDPVNHRDPSGLKTELICRPLDHLVGAIGAMHCYLAITPEPGSTLGTERITLSLFTTPESPSVGNKFVNAADDAGNGTYSHAIDNGQCLKSSAQQDALDKAVMNSFNTQPSAVPYMGVTLYPLLQPINSNTFAHKVLEGAGVTVFPTTPSGAWGFR